jgi:hypothetical protein
MTARKHFQLPVLSHNGRWLIRFRGKRAEFADRKAAVHAAILAAFEQSRNGTPTQVVSIDDHLAIEIIWTYGVDPDPPGAFADARRMDRPSRTTAPRPRVARGAAMGER